MQGQLTTATIQEKIIPVIDGQEGEPTWNTIGTVEGILDIDSKDKILTKGKIQEVINATFLTDITTQAIRGRLVIAGINYTVVYVEDIALQNRMLHIWLRLQ